MPDIIPLKGRKAAPRASRSTMETLIITPDQVNAWRVPPFQRPVRVNAKVKAIADEIRTNGVSITGMITLGKLTGDNAYYIVDGQHRIEAFRISGMSEIIADIRVVHFDTMADMADEFVQLNTAIVRMRPDDLLRGLTPSLPLLQRILRECPFIGYDQLRRGGASGPIVGLAAILRTWHASNSEAPNNSNSGVSINQLAAALEEDSVAKLIRFSHLAMEAWGRDPEYYRLWGGLNMGVNMWLYRRLVLDDNRRAKARISTLTETQFKHCLMALSANSNYLAWLPGRLLNDRDRSPALSRIKAIFMRRLIEGGMAKPYLPQPAWASK